MVKIKYKIRLWINKHNNLLNISNVVSTQTCSHYCRKQNQNFMNIVHNFYEQVFERTNYMVFHQKDKHELHEVSHAIQYVYFTLYTIVDLTLKKKKFAWMISHS